MLSSHVTLELMLLKQANTLVNQARINAGVGDLKLALSNVATVLGHWIEVLEREDDKPVQRRD